MVRADDGEDAMSGSAPRTRGGRPTPPPRDILGGQVCADELPDIARPAVSWPASPPASGASRGPQPSLGPWALPWHLAGIILGAQAAAIADGLDRGLVPPPLVPGAVLLKAQLRAAALVLSAGGST
jgi:hypothetical protein